MSWARATSPSPTRRCSRRRSHAGSSTSDVAIRSSASCPASMRWASSRSSSPVSRLTRPISFRYSRTVSDVPPSPLRSDAEGGAAPPQPAGAVAVAGLRAGQALGGRDVLELDLLVDEDAGLRQPGAHGGDDVLGQLDLRHHAGDVVRRHRPGDRALSEERRPLPRGDLVDRREHGRRHRRPLHDRPLGLCSLQQGCGDVLGLRIGHPLSSRRTSRRPVSQRSNCPAASQPASGSSSSSSKRRVDTSSALRLRSRSAPQDVQLTAAGRTHEVAHLGPRVGVDVGHAEPLEEVPHLGIGLLDGLVDVTVRVGQRAERAQVRLVREQRLHQPGRHLVPPLDEQRQHDELRVLPEGRSDRRRPHLDLPRPALGDPHEVGHRQPRVLRHLAGVQLADVDVRVLVDDRHGRVGQLRPGLRRDDPASGAQHPPDAEAQERLGLVDRSPQRGRILAGQLAGILAPRQAGHLDRHVELALPLVEPLGRALAGGVGVEGQHHPAGEALEQAHVLRGQRGPARGDGDRARRRGGSRSRPCSPRTPPRGRP